MSAFFTTLVTLLVRAITYGAPFLYGSTGETLTEKSGHLNLGIPGIMCVGASTGCVAIALYNQATGFAGSPVFCLLIAVIASFLGGGLLGLIYSFLTVSLRANQNVTGLALTTFGIGASTYMVSRVKVEDFVRTNQYFTASLRGVIGAPKSDSFFNKLVTVLEDLFLSYGFMIYLALIIAFVAAYVLKKTRVGLHLRAVGENPATADAAGINVNRYKYFATCIGSGIAALGGLCYIMDNLQGNWEYSIDEIGWLAIALVIFTLWRPNLGVLGSIAFGALRILGNSNTVRGVDKSIMQMIPYLVTILVLIIISMRKKKEHQPPAHLGLSYFREDR